MSRKLGNRNNFSLNGMEPNNLQFLLINISVKNLNNLMLDSLH